MCAQDAGGWGVKLEALKMVVALVLNWRKATQHHLPTVLESAWALFAGCLPLYVSGIVRGDEDIDDGEVGPRVAAFFILPYRHRSLNSEVSSKTAGEKNTQRQYFIDAGVGPIITAQRSDTADCQVLPSSVCMPKGRAMTAAFVVQVDEDADDLSFPAMISQLFEFVLCIVSNSTFLPLLQPVLPELAYLTIGAPPCCVGCSV